MPADERLRLIALDAEDLAIVSAHLQDAVTKVGDCTWLPSEKRFVMAMNRFVWENARAGWFRRGEHERRRSALHFERVEAVQRSGLDQHRLDQVLSLLAIRFDPRDAPGGDVTITFAGDATIRLVVECLEAQLTDLGPAWSTPHLPRHPA